MASKWTVPPPKRKKSKYNIPGAIYGGGKTVIIPGKNQESREVTEAWLRDVFKRRCDFRVREEQYLKRKKLLREGRAQTVEPIKAADTLMSYNNDVHFDRGNNDPQSEISLAQNSCEESARGKCTTRDNIQASASNGQLSRRIGVEDGDPAARTRNHGEDIGTVGFAARRSPS